MKITILTVGTRGDVQPFVALGLGLKAAGYDVTVATNTSFESFVREHGLRYAPLYADFMELLQTAEGRKALEAGRGSLGLLRTVMPMLRLILDDSWEAAQESDAIVYHPKALSGYHIAEKLGAPGFATTMLPILQPTRTFPNPLLPVRLNLGGSFNRLSYSVFLRLTTVPYHRMVNQWRREVLHLPPRPVSASDLVRDGRPVPVLYAYSPHVIPRPNDWPDSVTVTGYWFLDQAADWRPPEALVRFLESGPPPVYVGFGSMVGRDPERLTSIVVEALKRSGERGLIATGWGGIEAANLPESVFPIESAPHDWLFPRVAAVVHHGGAGTTAAGLRVGKPTVVCPFFGDQPFWGRRIFELGVGPEPIPQKKL